MNKIIQGIQREIKGSQKWKGGILNLINKPIIIKRLKYKFDKKKLFKEIVKIKINEGRIWIMKQKKIIFLFFIE